VTILEGNAFIEQFTEEKLKDPKILDFMKKVEVVADEEIENLPRPLRYTVKIDILTKDGRTFHIREEYPKGHPKNPFTREELLWKFKQLAGKAISDESRLDRIIEAEQNLEDVERITDFTKLLTKQGA